MSLRLNTICIAIPFAAYGAILILQNRRRLKEIERKAKEQQNEYYRLFFFGGKTICCDDHFGSPCNKDDCPMKIFSFFQEIIESAQSTVDVCINVFTSHDIALSLIKAHRKNVLVRIVADKNMSTNKGSKIHSLIEYGIKVKMPSVSHTMHSKMLIVDRKTVVSGSANFTHKGMTANWENIIVTTQKDIVGEVSKNFETLWNSKEVEPFDEFFLGKINI